MRILVLGAGLAGITTAWFLAKEGAQVTVIDRRNDAGLETSFANGGQIAASLSRPWATPYIPQQMLSFLGKKDSPLSFNLAMKPSDIAWSISFLLNCTSKRYGLNSSVLNLLSNYSRSTFDIFLNQNLNFDFNKSGLLAIFKDPRRLEAASKELKKLNNFGEDDEILDTESCINLEPSLQSSINKKEIIGGIFSKNGATGNAYMFVKQLKEQCITLGVKFLMETNVISLLTSKNSISGIQTSKGKILSKTVVVALAQDSKHLLSTINIGIPVVPVKGHSITFPMPDDYSLPSLGIMDEEGKIVTSRLGNFFRAAGTAQFASGDKNVDLKQINIIISSLKKLYPEANLPSIANANSWAGVRSVTPDGPPILGPVQYTEGLYLNTGHGPLGWSLAAGSAKIVKDMILGQKIDIDIKGLTISRF